MTITVTTAEAQEKLSDLVNQVAHNNEQIILTRRGKDIAVLISLEDYAKLQGITDKGDLQEATEALKQARDSGTIPIEQVKAELGG